MLLKYNRFIAWNYEYVPPVALHFFLQDFLSKTLPHSFDIHVYPISISVLLNSFCNTGTMRFTFKICKPISVTSVIPSQHLEPIYYYCPNLWSVNKNHNYCIIFKVSHYKHHVLLRWVLLFPILWIQSYDLNNENPIVALTISAVAQVTLLTVHDYWNVALVFSLASKDFYSI
jgi:hypothetical protein